MKLWKVGLGDEGDRTGTLRQCADELWGAARYIPGKELVTMSPPNGLSVWRSRDQFMAEVRGYGGTGAALMELSAEGLERLLWAFRTWLEATEPALTKAPFVPMLVIGERPYAWLRLQALERAQNGHPRGQLCVTLQGQYSYPSWYALKQEHAVWMADHLERLLQEAAEPEVKAAPQEAPPLNLLTEHLVIRPSCAEDLAVMHQRLEAGNVATTLTSLSELGPLTQVWGRTSPKSAEVHTLEGVVISREDGALLGGVRLTWGRTKEWCDGAVWLAYSHDPTAPDVLMRELVAVLVDHARSALGFRRVMFGVPHHLQDRVIVPLFLETALGARQTILDRSEKRKSGMFVEVMGEFCGVPR